MKRGRLAAVMLAATALAGSTVGVRAQTVARPWANAKLSPDQRARLVLKAMTLDEKVALLHGPMAMPLGPTAKMPAGAVGSAGFIAGNEHVTLSADPRLLAAFDTARPGWRIDAGSYAVAVGRDASTDDLTGSTKLAATRIRP